MEPPVATSGGERTGASRWTTWAIRLAGLLISILAAVAIASIVDLEATLDHLRGAAPLVLLGGVAVIGVQTVILAIRWRWLLPSTGDGGLVPLPTALRVLLLGTLVNFGLPGRVGDAARALLVRRATGVSAVSGIGSIVVERGLDVAMLGLAAWVAGLAVGGPQLAVQVAAVVTIAAAIGLVVLWSGMLSRIVAVLGRRWGAGRLGFAIGPMERLAIGVEIARARGHLLRASLATLGSVLLDGVIVWLAATSLGIPIGPMEAMLAGAAAVLMTAIPSAPANVGTFELAGTFILVSTGLTPEAALAVAVVSHAIIVLPVAVAGLAVLAVGALRSTPSPGMVPPSTPAELGALVTGDAERTMAGAGRAAPLPRAVSAAETSGADEAATRAHNPLDGARGHS
jgi:glycosyltransferase 2 family protein